MAQPHRASAIIKDQVENDMLKTLPFEVVRSNSRLSRSSGSLSAAIQRNSMLGNQQQQQIEARLDGLKGVFIELNEQEQEIGRISIASIPRISNSSLQNQAIGSRIKKFAASKATNSTLITKILTPQFFGNDGYRFFQNLMQNLELYYGEEEAIELEKSALTILMKIKIMFDDGLVVNDQGQALKEILHDLLEFIRDGLNGGKASENNLVLRIKDLKILCGDFFNDLMTLKNSKKMHSLLESIGTASFIKAVFSSSRHGKLRSEMTSILEKMLDSSKNPKNCLNSECKEAAIASKDKFQSCGYCMNHHIDYQQRIISDPLLDYFIAENSSIACLYFRSFLKRVSDSEDKSAASYLTCYDLLKSIQHWRKIESSEIRVRSALSIFQTFIEPKNWTILQLPAIDIKYDTDLKLSLDFFDAIYKSCYTHLERQFPVFLLSQEFNGFIGSTTPPRSLLHILSQ